MRYFIKVAYDGTEFSGSQIQGDTPTVQLAINTALSVLLREPILSFGASRTDQGVHALGNFYHFDSSYPLYGDFIYKMNSLLPPGIAILDLLVPKSNDINARFDALSRTYRYRIYHTKNPFLRNRAYFYPFKIDQRLLAETCKLLVKFENFETFSKRNSQSKTFNCKIIQSYWIHQEGELQYVVEANRFLRGMVRALVGTQLRVARGKITLDEFVKSIEKRDCTLADFSVAGHGLYLESVNYPDGLLRKAINI